MAKKKPDDVSIGKFDILATYTYAKALSTASTTTRPRSGAWWRRSWGPRPGWATGAAPTRTIPGRQGRRREEEKDDDHRRVVRPQVADKMGGFFDDVFLPTMKKLVEAGLS